MPAERAFYTLDADLRFIGVGPRALSMWRKTRQELMGRHIVDAFPALAGGVLHRALLEALQTLRPVRVRAKSLYLPKDVDVEIYPVAKSLQVTFTLLDGNGQS